MEGIDLHRLLRDAPEPAAAEALWTRAAKLAGRVCDEEAERRIAERRDRSS